MVLTPRKKGTALVTGNVTVVRATEDAMVGNPALSPMPTPVFAGLRELAFA